MELQGKEYLSPKEYVVCHEVIRRFADSLGEENAIFFDCGVARQKGYEDIVAPQTFLFSVFFTRLFETPLFAGSENVFQLSRIIHTEQTVELKRPVVAGDRLLLKIAVVSVRSRNTLDFLTIEGTFYNANESAADNAEKVDSTNVVAVLKTQFLHSRDERENTLE